MAKPNKDLKGISKMASSVNQRDSSLSKTKTMTGGVSPSNNNTQTVGTPCDTSVVGGNDNR